MSEEKIDCSIKNTVMAPEHEKSGSVTVCRGCLERLENSAGRKISDTRLNPFVCRFCGKEGDGGINISFSASYGSRHDTGGMADNMVICDECFEKKLPALLEIGSENLGM
jgi:hypothetical protein